MGGCCGKKAGVAYEATFPDGSKQTYATVGEAQKALTAAGGGTFKAVAK